MQGAAQPNLTDRYTIPRQNMIERLRGHYGIRDERVLDAMSRIHRHLFVPEAIESQAYKDNALPIAFDQTISQPFIVARMTELLELKGTEKVLEIGAGSGYQTAVLCELARKVFAIERIDGLARDAEQRLRRLGYRNFSLKSADGTNGWETYQPFDAILVAAGGPEIPVPLVRQLKPGGHMVIPIGANPRSQVLIRVTRTEKGYTQDDFGSCSFVPLIGEHGWAT